MSIYLYVLLLAILAAPGFNQVQIAAAASQNATTISIATKEASPGDVVDVPVTVSGIQDVHVLQLFIAYNEEVLTGASIENLHSSISGATTNPDSNPIVISWQNVANGLDLPDDTKLFDLRFGFCQDEESCVQHNYWSDIFFVEDESYIGGPPPDFNDIPVTLNNGVVFDPGIDTSTLTLHISGEGQVLINGNPYTDDFVAVTGTTLNLEAVPEDHWEFGSWSGDLSGTHPAQEIIMIEDKEVTAAFTAVEPVTFTIMASAGPGGNITPEGNISVLEGSSQQFDIEAEIGYYIEDVIVDGQSAGLINSYVFENVGQDHSILALFQAEESEIPISLEISEKTVPEGEDLCFNALQIISVSDFTIKAGGSAELIAGESIHIFPDTQIEQGASFHARVTADNNYCGDGQQSMLAIAKQMKKSMKGPR